MWAFSACAVDPVSGVVRRTDGTAATLSPRELALLRYLVDHPDRTVTRDELLGAVWQDTPTRGRAVDTSVWRLREKLEADATRPDHLLTVHAEGYRFVPVAAAPIDDDGFVGREPEVRLLLAALDTPGSWVVRGPPGVGKTRLVRHVVRRLGHRLPVLFVELGECREPDDVGRAVAVALALEEKGPGALLSRVVWAIRERGPLLVFVDNAEGATEAVRELVAAVRAEAPEARLVTTSRTRLRDGSVDVRLGGLPVVEAVALYEILAARVRPGRADEATDTVEQLVRHLDCLPLAIALAAGRAGAMSPRAMLDRLDRRFQLLQSNERGLAPRQRTLRAALEGSWELLSPEERTTLVTCAVFRGGFDRAAAAGVLDRPDAGVLLTALEDRSLVERRGDRYTLAASVQEYAAERLADDPVVRQGVEDRHVRWFVANPAGPDALWNLVAATRSARCADDAVALAIRVFALTSTSGPLALGRTVLGEVLARPDLPPHGRATLQIHRLTVGRLLADAESDEDALGSALHDARTVGDPTLVATALRETACVRWTRGRQAEADVLLAEAVDLGRALDDPRSLHAALALWSQVHLTQGRWDLARREVTECLALARRLADPEAELHAIYALAQIEGREGHTDEARRVLRRGLDVARDHTHRVIEAKLRFELGNLDLDDGRYDDAVTSLAAAVALAGSVGDRRHQAMARANLGDAERRRGRLDEARDHLVLAVRQMELAGHWVASVLRAMLGQVAVDAGRAEEAVALLRQAADELRALDMGPREAEVRAKLGGALRVAGHPALAREAVARAETLARESGDPGLVARVLVHRGACELADGVDVRATLLEAERLLDATGMDGETRDAVAGLRTAYRQGRSRS